MKKLMIVSIILTLATFNTAYSRSSCKGKNGKWYDYDSTQCSPHRATKNKNVTNNDEPSAASTEAETPKAISTIIPHDNIKTTPRMGPHGIIGSRQTQPDT